VIQQQAIQEGMQTMYEDGIGKALQGITTLEEVLRVTTEA
jgi:general secretion pathway protein E